MPAWARAKRGSSSTACDEQAPGEPVGVLGALIEELPAAQIELIGVHVAGRRPGDRLRLGRQQPDPEGSDDAAGDLVLHGEDVGEHPVVALGPEMPARGRVGQLRRDPNPLPGPADAPLQDVAGTQPGTHFTHVEGRPLEGEGRLARGHEQTGDLGEVGDEVVGDAVAEIVLVGVVTQIRERQDRDRGPLGRVEGRARRCRGGGHPTIAHPVDPHGPLDVLEPALAHGDEAAVELAPQMIVGGAGDDDAARLGELLESRRDVHPVAIEVAVGVVDDIAEVDADPAAEALRLGHRILALGHSPLNEQGAAHRVDDARELDQGAVAHQLDDASLVLGDERVDQLLSQRLQAGERAILVPLHEPGVADHVRRQDGREPPLDPCRRHRRPPVGAGAGPSGRAPCGGLDRPVRRCFGATS